MSSLSIRSSTVPEDDDPAHLREQLNDLRTRTFLFEAILSTTEDFAYVFDQEGRFLFANRRLLEVWGRRLDEIIGKTCLQLGYPAWHDEMHRREISQVVATGKPVTGEVAYTAPTGISGVYEYIFTPVFGEDGEVTVITGTTRDVTARKDIERRQRFLVELSDALRPLSDERQIATACARLLCEHLVASRCAYGYLSDDGSWLHIMGDYTCGVPSMVGRYQIEDFGEEFVEAMKGSGALVVDDLSSKMSSTNLARLVKLEIGAVVAVPLHKEKRLVALLAVHQNTPRHWMETEVELIRLVANRCWESLERSRVANVLQSNEARYRFLAELAELARTSTDAEQIIRSVTARLARQMLVTHCAYADVQDDGEHFTIRYDYAAPGVASIAGDYVLSSFGERIAGLLRTGRSIVIRDVRRDFAADAEAFLALGVQATICCSLIREGHLVALMAVHQAEPRAWTEAEITLVEAAVERSWTYIERASAIKALTESEARFRELADVLPQIIWTALPDGRVDYFNRFWYQYTGLDGSTPLDGQWRAAAHPEDVEINFADWEVAIREGAPYQGVCRLRRQDGSYRWHTGRSIPIRDEAGRIVRWLGTNIDDHDHRILYEQNQQLLASERSARAEAERASQVKDEFLATLSHELRTPLNAILGWAQVLTSSSKPEDLAVGLGTIERNARSQAQIIEDLLDMSRIISGKVRLDIRRVDLPGIIQASIDTVLPAAQARGVRIVTEFDPLDHPLDADPNRLQQVFWNLLSNSIKFTPRGGVVQVILRQPNSHVEVSVEDTGEGIAPDFLPHVFDRFRQQDASTTRKHGGLGLGLAIVKQLVELHGGSIKTESAGQGQGATFVVSLPLDVAPGGSSGEVVPAALGSSFSSHLSDTRLSLRGVKVLVVDDEEDARHLIRRLLEESEAKVCVAASTAEALSLFEAESPDVIISDIGMPGEDGYQLIRKLRQLGPEKGGGIPAIALTAYARSQDRIKAILAGFHLHMVKPVDAAELLTMVASLARRT